jgi:hypothetical protein
MGTKFGGAISQKVKPDAVLAAMSDAQNLEALSAYHELAVVFEGLPAKYAESVQVADLGPTLLRRNGFDSRGDLMFQAAVNIRDTFRRAGSVGAIALPEVFDYQVIARSIRVAPANSVHQALDNAHALVGGEIKGFLHSHRGRALIDDKFSRCIENPEDSATLLSSINTIDPASGRYLLGGLDRSTGWRNRRRQILERKVQFLQNPRSYARTINMLRQAGCRVSHLLGPYELHIRSNIAALRSPAALVELLQMLRGVETGGEALFQDAAGRIDGEGVKRRLGYGLPSDIAWVPALVALTVQAGQLQLGRDLAKALIQIPNFASRVPVERWLGTLRAVRTVLPGDTPRLISQFDDVVVQQASCNFQFDDIAVCRAMGAYALFRHKETGRYWAAFQTRPLCLSIPKDAATRLFATAWLEPLAWVKDMRDEAEREISDDPNFVPSDMQQMLIIMARTQDRPSTRLDLAADVLPFGDRLSFRPFSAPDVDAIQEMLRS